MVCITHSAISRLKDQVVRVATRPQNFRYEMLCNRQTFYDRQNWQKCCGASATYCELAQFKDHMYTV